MRHNTRGSDLSQTSHISALIVYKLGEATFIWVATPIIEVSSLTLDC